MTSLGVLLVGSFLWVGSSFFLLFPRSFPFLSFFIWSSVWGLLLASGMAWIFLLLPKLLVETLTIGWCSLSTFTHCKELMKLARNLWWSNPSRTCYCCQWSRKGCVRWQPLQWIQWLPRDLGVKYVPGLFGRARISNNIIRDLSIELCWSPLGGWHSTSFRHFKT